MLNMAEPFLSEIRIFSFNFAPKGWAMCNGQLLPINQNQALFSLLGTTYGGNGQTNFALPELRGRCSMHEGSGMTLGERAGEEAHTLTQSEMPAHIHQLNGAAADADNFVVGGNLLGNFNNGYRSSGTLTTLIPATVGNTGGSQAHENRSPYGVANYCIALQGIFPSPN
jgi:microcystin-dependent protein